MMVDEQHVPELPTAELWCFWCDARWAAPVRMTPLQITQRLDEHEQAEHPQTLNMRNGDSRQDDHGS